MRPVRLGLAVAAGLLVLLALWVGWQTWQTSKSLSAAADDARTLQAAISEGDESGVDQSLSDLQDHAEDADDRTSGPTWSLMTHLPVYGDDAQGVRLVSDVLADLTSEGFAELADSATDLDAYAPKDGKIPLDSLEELQDPVTRAEAAFSRADERLSAEDTSGYVGRLKTDYDDLAERVSDASSALTTANKALGLLPDMLGGNGPRSYLLIFQNNAEIRASGGMPGAWALVHADDGGMEIEKQGTAGDFPNRDGQSPILPTSAEEKQVYGTQLGTYFQDANFTPDFTRSSELWHAWWDATFPDEPIDGVLSFDPIAMSYLLASTGPVQVGNVTLTQDNAVDELLSKPYLTGDNAAQDALFAQAAQSVFTAVTNNLGSPMEFLRGLQRGAREGRLHLTSFAAAEQDQIASTQLEGALPDDDGPTPRVYVSINDATGSKMSYYLRYHVSVASRSCSGGSQVLLGTMSVSQTIPEAEATNLPSFVTGGGLSGTAPGRQLVIVRIFGPTGGEASDLRIDAQKFDVESIALNNRPVIVAVAEITGPDDSVITWSMRTAASQQAGSGEVIVTPGVAPGSKSSAFTSACR